MLAYELFHNNKGSALNTPKKQFPIKKIFYKNQKITIDGKNLEEYNSNTTGSTKQLQNWLQMPLNTIDAKLFNLPDLRTGAAAANPYIEIYGTLKTNKSLESKLSISIGKKPNQIEHILDLTSGKIQCKSDGQIVLKLDKKNYLLGSDLLFSKYVDSGVIDETGLLNTKAYNNIATAFLEFVKKQKPDVMKFGTITFRLYILPDNSPIKFKTIKKEESEQVAFTDYFGNTVSEYASTSTKTAKFLSFDDKAFTINCMQKENFYKNLGIGNNSLEKVYTDPSQTFDISRLSWTFTDMSNPDFTFVETKKGILTQLYENYRLVKGKGPTESTQLKVICIRINQAKQEVLIDTNLTMPKMNEIFSNIEDVPILCFEVLIDNSGRNPIWNTYLYVVKNFLAGNKIPKNYLLAFFNKFLLQKRYDWVKLKNQSEQKEFFIKSNFCLQTLSTGDGVNSYMDNNEEFAQKIGQIARTYIDFKQNNHETDNSLSDILTYSKYDRERLRFIVSRVSRGAQLSKIADDKKNTVIKKISSLQPTEEIADDVASKDYSYFFFKGYYNSMEITA